MIAFSYGVALWDLRMVVVLILGVADGKVV